MIEIKNLGFAYPGTQEPAIRGIDFSIHKGEIFGFLGPSGSGKSTTQKILFKLLTGYSGNALIENKEVADWDKNLYEKIGVCFELPNHYLKLTAIENLRFFQSFYSKSKDPMTLLEQIGLKQDAHKKVAEYSKGMKMRLNFIRAILHDPEILFLDEPTSGLDPVNAQIVKNFIRELQGHGKTIFITTHQMHDADELCDRVAFIAEGTIKAMDTPQNLKVQYRQDQVEVLFQHETEKRIFPLKGLGNNSDFLQAIQSKEILTIHSKEATLEDIFIEVTGKMLVS